MSAVDSSLRAELQKGVLQQCLVMTKTVALKRNSTVVSISHSSTLAQPRVLMSSSPRGTKHCSDSSKISCEVT